MSQMKNDHIKIIPAYKGIGVYSLTNKVNGKKSESITIRVPKGQKAVIKAAADNAGESVNCYIKKAIDERMEGEARITLATTSTLFL